MMFIDDRSRKYMASTIAMMALSAITNAIAFTGSSYAFSKLGHHGEEMKRHDLAIEKLASARNKWVKDRQERIDMINEHLMQERKSEVKFNELDAAMAEYHRVFHKELPPLREPVLSDYWKGPPPKDPYHEEKLVASAVIALGVTYYVYKHY